MLSAEVFLKPSSTRKYVEVISYLYKSAYLPDPCKDNFLVQAALEGVKWMKGGDITRMLPITIEALLLI